MDKSIETRIRTLNMVLPEQDQDAVKKELEAAKGDWAKAAVTLKDKLPEASFQKVSLAHSLADWSDDHVHIVISLTDNPDVKSLRDVALRYNVESLTKLVKAEDLPETMPGATLEEKTKNFSVSLNRKLFAAEPTAVLKRMVQDAEVPIADASVRAGVTSFLGNQPDFNMRTTSIYTALKNPDAFKGIADDKRASVIEQLKILQLVQAISPIPEAVPVLMKANSTSAFHVAEMPESTFLKAYGKTLGEETARQVYTLAINNRIRNEHALMAMRESVRGTGLAVIDGKQTMEMRIISAQKTADEKAVPVNLDTLFGDMDYCECEECNSVYSPAAYFVELLNFLRNNNLDPDSPNTGQKGIAGTPLEKLFRRRPDLGCLELTCENTNTVLPYVDLVNEVMESFVVHLGEYHSDANDPKQAKLEAFNVDKDTTSSELLSQPQNVNYDAYCILKNTVYPFTLPYHQPIDAARIFLKYLGTSRYELLNRFRTANETYDNGSQPPTDLSADEQKELKDLHKIFLDRAVDAEFLRLAQEEYIILTKEAFWPKRYFEITQKKNYTDEEYRQNIGVKAVHEYYGYGAEADMLSTDESQHKGLTFVKKQFLTRTGIQYIDLVELLKTRFINPNFPQSKALTILESIRFSYRFLQKLVDAGSTDPKVRFAKLIDFLEKTQSFLPLVDTLLHPDPCKQQKPAEFIDNADLRKWVYCCFEKVGKLIVLESGEGPHLPIEGRLMGGKPPALVGILHKDGTIVDEHGAVIGNVNVFGQAVGTDGTPFVEKGKVFIQDESGQKLGFINASGIWSSREKKLNWLPAQDTCDLDKVRLIHLDGTAVSAEEYDRMQRFIRLWRKMGWTIDETDKALIGLASVAIGADGKPITTGDRRYVDFDAFIDNCLCPENGDDICCDDATGQNRFFCDVTCEFLHQLVAVRKLLELTGLPLIKLLTFWANISTAGEKSLYSRLFLTHNMLGIDKVFEADKNGNYLTQGDKLTEHVPILMAALKLKADDITAIMTFRSLSDELTLSKVSILYRHGLLAKILHVKVADLRDIAAVFGEPFANADQTLKLLKTWGKMEDAGFTFRQLNYLIQNHDDSQLPLAPAKKTILKISKTLYDGLNGIDHDHLDVQKVDEATSDLVRTRAGLLFEQSVVEQVMGLLEGTAVYTTNAPANQTITVPDDLAKKLKYINQKDANQPSAIIQVAGILTEAEKTLARGLCTHLDWAKAIERVGKQALNFFNDALSGIFPNTAEARAKLLAGDVSIPADQQGPGLPDPNTAPAKRYYFLQYYLPFLRKRLARRFVVDTLSAAAGLASNVTDVLLSEVLKVGTSQESALSALEKIKEKAAGSASGWTGYLIPLTDGDYTFIAIGDTKPAPLKIDGQSIDFPNQQEDPSNIWFTNPVPKLKNGQLYWLELTDRTAGQLQWKTAASPKAHIPSSALLPDYSAQGTEEVFIKLYKVTLLVNGFSLSSDEVSYWQGNSVNSDPFNFNALTLKHWKRLQAYTDLRDNLPKLDTTLLDLFKWASRPDAGAAKLSEKLEAATAWKKERIDKLLTADHFDLNRLSAFQNEVASVIMKKALAVADKIGVDIDQLFAWAKPGSKFRECHQIAEDIRMAVRSRFDQEDWEQVVKPLNDQLREDQKQALISYLLVQQDLIDWGVIDADSLFEFFLIDVQMGACRETSRIKQAISSVQLFIQRCLLGLEEKYGVPNDVVARDRWEWMQKYRVWEANRKVFLYPENWIQPELRDDKSPFYKELESELLQKDINTQTVEDALKSYLFKVDEVANLKVVGLFLEQDKDKDGNDLPIKLHVFSRTRNAPYFFYYRYFDIQELNWYPWEKVQVDIPNYDVENEGGSIADNGTYVIPVVWNKHLLIFFPQFVRKTRTQDVGDKITTTKDANGNTQVPVTKPSEFWEIKMAWSEYRNGKWTQKQVSKNALYDTYLFPINSYFFVPDVQSDKVTIKTKIQGLVTKPPYVGAFEYVGSQLFYYGRSYLLTMATEPDDFHYFSKSQQIHSLQITGGGSSPELIQKKPYFEASDPSQQQLVVRLQEGGSGLNFFHPFVHDLLGKLNTGDLNDLFDFYQTITDPAKKSDAYGAFISDGSLIYHELKRPYSLYNWEAGFHVPMQLADRLMKSQQFDQALSMCHYVFNPLAKTVNGEDPSKRFWRFPPFKEINTKNVLETLFLSLKPNIPNDQINEWRGRPFQPHVVARSRPSAYMKWVAMKYIEILIAYGDYYFRQNTLETIPLAIQCYVMAAHLYGPHGQQIPRRGKIQPQTYYSLLDKWDAFGNAMVEMELAFPFSNQTPFPIGVSNGVVGIANVFGFASTLYFCIPDNPNLRNLRNTIDDRLLKIRSCENIEGVFYQPPLWEPPIEPGLLVQAAAQGLSISSVLNDLNSPMPNYRFYYLLQKAIELCSELKALGNAFLSSKEKQDGEHLSQMRARHESGIQNLVMEIKKQQLDEAQKSLEALQQSRKGPVYRLQHCLKLIGEDLGKVPDGNTDFSELPDSIEKPVDESGLKLIQYEKEEMDKVSDAADWQIGIGITETLASILNIIPTIGVYATPIGVGGTGSWGGSNLGAAASAVARGMQTYSSHLSYQSSSAQRKGGFLRQLQDRVQQANIAGYEIKNIDKQILTQQIRIAIANQEIENQQQQIDNAQEVEDYLRNKYTNEELYSWMEGSIRTLYYQAYTLAYDLAKKAEKAYRFERGLSDSNFIQFGYWDAAHDGLLSGERLYIGLKQLEAAYQEKRGYDFEITKPVSLRQISPMALIQLKETGTCEFALPEILFDMDHPGHYMRRIKSVALTVPCVVGPYTSLNCTLRLLEHKFRTSAIAKDKNDYLEKTDETDERFSTVNVPITSIAVSTGQNDSGVFELNFRDERYIPFEGAGAISKWRIELPSDFRQFAYDTISDVILHLRYTAVDGGDKLKKPAADSVQEYIKSVEDLSRQEGLFAAFDLKHDFPNEWYKATNPSAGTTERLMTLDNLNERLPIFTKGRSADKILATDVFLFTPASLAASALTLSQAADEYSFSDGPSVGATKSFVIKDISCPISSWQLKIVDVKTNLDRLWLIVRYVLK